jgi:type VI secretion system protein VasG
MRPGGHVIGQNSVPSAIEDCRRQIDCLQVELGILERESARGAHHDQRMEEAIRALKQAEIRLAALEKRWAEENRQVEEIRNLSAQLEKLHGDWKAAAVGAPRDGPPAEPTPEAARLRAELDAKTTALRQLQGETPLMQICVDAQTIAAVIAGWPEFSSARCSPTRSRRS